MDELERKLKSAMSAAHKAAERTKQEYLVIRYEGEYFYTSRFGLQHQFQGVGSDDVLYSTQEGDLSWL